MGKATVMSMLLLLFSVCTHAQSDLDDAFDKFSALYKQRFGQIRACLNPTTTRFSVCSPALRNDGNAPYILHHSKPTEKVVVLLHGLSDSPFYMRGIAQALFDKGMNVIVPLNVGHGQLVADDDMSDSDLAERWKEHLNDVIAIAPELGNKIYLGGFSTGGALVVDHYLHHPENVAGIMLFSGALALDSGVEKLSRIWGIQWIAGLLDGEYITHGPNPYKYPTIASFAGLELMEVINDIRDQLAQGKTVDVPVFAAHSQADSTTPISGIEDLLAHTTATNTFFVIDKGYKLCHANLVMNQAMVNDLHFNKQNVDLRDPCAVPTKNPLFSQMIMMMDSFVDN
ncbi:alpha/beta hydrolase [Alteromonas sp. 14N.309.X.WAT.G.H12]|uniref:alpha/beta hydrolase n=1 Tax=Alteromonas sp. 14N.309.X.WAT.G.H12 TaxID=3120824 RepID=UPI002FD078D6